MLVTDFGFGSPCWLDLGAPDVDAAVAFYTAVFDWKVEFGNPEGGGYPTFLKEEKVVGAVGQLSEEGARSAWTIYFQTPDANVTAEQARQAGGTVGAGPSDFGGSRIAQLTDPQGARFGLWEPRETPGLGLVHRLQSLTWTELITTDATAAKDFYHQLFDWTATDVQLPGGGTYSIVTPSGRDANRMHGGIMQLDAENLPDRVPYWHPVFADTDCDATAARVTDNGGSVTQQPVSVPGIGRLAVLRDPAGAEFVALVGISGESGGGAPLRRSSTTG